MTQNKDKMRQHLKRSGFGTKQSLFCRRAASLALFRRSLLTNPSASANVNGIRPGGMARLVRIDYESEDFFAHFDSDFVASGIVVGIRI